MIRWPLDLAEREAYLCGDDEVNGDPDSLNGEEDERGFDDMPLAVGWDDEPPTDDGYDDAEEIEDED